MVGLMKEYVKVILYDNGTWVLFAILPLGPFSEYLNRRYNDVTAVCVSITGSYTTTTP